MAQKKANFQKMAWYLRGGVKGWRASVARHVNACAHVHVCGWGVGWGLRTCAADEQACVRACGACARARAQRQERMGLISPDHKVRDAHHQRPLGQQVRHLCGSKRRGAQGSTSARRAVGCT